MLERLSFKFFRALQRPEIGEIEKGVLEVLAVVTSAMMKPDDWPCPFSPLATWDRMRTRLPQDLDEAQPALLARIAPRVDDLILLARVDDVAWPYGDRANVELVDLAIDAYRSVPLIKYRWSRPSAPAGASDGRR